MQFQSITITESQSGKRLDQVLSEELGQSRAQIQKLIKSGKVRLNNSESKSSQKVHAGDKIHYKTERKTSPLQAQNIPIEVLFEDEDILVLNKQAGIVVHPDESGHKDKTLVNAILHHSKELSSGSNPERPGIVHRLDKDTSGALIVAKNNAIHQKLAKAFENREVGKSYLALVKGHPKSKEGRIEAPIKRSSKDRQRMGIHHQGKNAYTEFKILKSYKESCLLEVSIKTGRTHQIRLHLASIGHPVIGDNKYGDSNFNKEFKKKTGLKRQFLHAHTLKILNKMYTAALPKELDDVLNQLD